MKKQINDGFKMWGNYLEAVDNFTKGDDEKFGRFMRIICYYGIYGEEIADTEIEKLFFTGIKSSIEASIKNIKNGMKGGRNSVTNENKSEKPTLEAIQDYCKERGSKIDPAAFFDYYQRNGWVYGKNKTPIKDWKACVRTWERNEKDTSGATDLHNKSGDDVL